MWIWFIVVVFFVVCIWYDTKMTENSNFIRGMFAKKQTPPLKIEEPELADRTDVRCKFYNEETDEFVTYH
jgi:hypothetical protein